MNATQRPPAAHHAAHAASAGTPLRPPALQRLGLQRLRALPQPAERAMHAQHDAELEQMLPVLGPLFGLGMLLFTVWDMLLDPHLARYTLALRALAVLAGSAAYFPNALRWSVEWRCTHIYVTHVCALILCAFILPQGLVYGLAGIAACDFAAALCTLRLPVFARMLAAPTVLYVVLSAWRLPWLLCVSGLMQYAFTVALATVMLLVMRMFQQKSFLLEQQLLHLSQHDSLTGACNRRYLEEVAERELALAQRHGRKLAVAMLDIDHFKQVNDQYGHETGDRVLQALVRTCQGELREIDHFGRLGGEEFVCVLPETDRDDALRCAERLRHSLSMLAIATPFGPLHFTVSVGVAVYGPGHANWPALLHDADLALYRAKHDGRNRVVLASLR
ncbi:GGDEF domain-containing protein [Duganella sp. LX20W]|uniref:diguanylate cyclase n=1 Tax=Rugamonas brunnea TaxID=2758569 RepID=A0A7W2ES38_9BURK|nr:GGDEF domain-containing protein [Rugamonas brunnea]MBA5637607.1 GGDEF domain-containing protein [Rugamonas brunnea]